jgi:hypothetical protein
MSVRVIRAVAVWLVLLAVLPFTAPFSTCDLTVPAREFSGAHIDLWLKPAPDTDKAPAVASDAALSAPRSAVVAAAPAATLAPARPSRPSRLILRI